MLLGGAGARTGAPRDFQLQAKGGAQNRHGTHSPGLPTSPWLRDGCRGRGPDLLGLASNCTAPCWCAARHFCSAEGRSLARQPRHATMNNHAAVDWLDLDTSKGRRGSKENVPSFS